MSATRSEMETANSKLSNGIPLKKIAEMSFVEGKKAKDIITQIKEMFPDCTLRDLGGDNNKNILIQKNDNSASVVVQVSKPKYGAEMANQELQQGKPNFLPIGYNRTIAMIEPDESVDTNINKFDTGNLVIVSVMEKCSASLEGHAAQLNAEQRYDDAVGFAANMGQQLSAILDTMSKKDIVWTDMKPGNILLRDNNEIVIADIKGFCPVNMLLVKDYGGKIVLDNSGATTPLFLSDHFFQKFHDIRPGKEAKQTWELEYSYQVGVALYTAATSQVKYSNYNESEPSPEFNFNFDHPSFETEDGRRLKMVINALCANDPNMRMHHKDAAILLAVLRDEQKFNEMYNYIDYAKLMEQQAFASKVKAGSKEESKNKSIFQRVLTKEKEAASTKTIEKPAFEGYLTKYVADTAKAAAAATVASTSSTSQASSTASPDAKTKNKNRLSKTFSSSKILGVLHQGGPIAKKAPEVTPEAIEETKSKTNSTKSGIMQKLTGRDHGKSKTREPEPEPEIPKDQENEKVQESENRTSFKL